MCCNTLANTGKTGEEELCLLPPAMFEGCRPGSHGTSDVRKSPKLFGLSFAQGRQESGFGVQQFSSSKSRKNYIAKGPRPKKADLNTNPKTTSLPIAAAEHPSLKALVVRSCPSDSKRTDRCAEATDTCPHHGPVFELLLKLHSSRHKMEATQPMSWVGSLKCDA